MLPLLKAPPASQDYAGTRFEVAAGKIKIKGRGHFLKARAALYASANPGSLVRRDESFLIAGWQMIRP
jgi:hypothetical protein